MPSDYENYHDVRVQPSWPGDQVFDWPVAEIQFHRGNSISSRELGSIAENRFRRGNSVSPRELGFAAGIAVVKIKSLESIVRTEKNAGY